MERKILLISTLITLGAIAFLSGYLFMPNAELERQTRQNFDQQNLGGQTGLITERFNDKVEAGSSENKVPDIVPLSGRKFIAFVNQFSDSKKIVAVTANGEIIEIDLINLTEKVVSVGQAALMEAVLSPAGDSLIYSFYDTRNNKKQGYLNFKKGESYDIVGNLKSAAFSPYGDQAAYLISNEGGGEELLIAKDGKIIKQAFKTRLGAAIINWPSDFISILSYGKDGFGNLFVLKNNGDLNKVLSRQYDLNVKWSPSGERVVFSAKSNDGSAQLFFKDAKNGGAITILGVNTEASKCVWASEEGIICGVKNQLQLKDEFYKISVNDGTKIPASTPSINLLVKDLALNQSGDILFVLNDIDDKLYALKIKEAKY